MRTLKRLLMYIYRPELWIFDSEFVEHVSHDLPQRTLTRRTRNIPPVT